MLKGFRSCFNLSKLGLVRILCAMSNPKRLKQNIPKRAMAEAMAAPSIPRLKVKIIKGSNTALISAPPT